jgi:uncharacterized protein YbbC (DUF1343 family)
MKKIIIVIGIITHSFLYSEFKLGLETLSGTYGNQLRNQGITKVALLTNHTGVDQQKRRTVDILIQRNVPITQILVPEHGLEGKVEGGHTVPHEFDSTLHIPIVSVYDGKTNKINKELLAHADTVIVDLQDVGVRHFTYISTVFELLKAARLTKTPIVVLDRPNPAGAVMDGPLVEAHLISFISAAPIPLRHGMTIGELARYFNKYELNDEVLLTVIPMQDYVRTHPAPLLSPLSPNMRTTNACRLYPLLGTLSELRPSDIGMGTNQVFEVWSLPEEVVYQNFWDHVISLLKSYNIEARMHRYFSPHKKKWCNGVQLYTHTPIAGSTFTVLVELCVLMYHAGISLTPSVSFDKVTGTTAVRALLSNPFYAEQLLKDTKKQLEGFYKRAQEIFLYSPFPQIMIH